MTEFDVGIFNNWLGRIQYSVNMIVSRLYWKVRLVLRAIYASTTKDAARSLAHRLQEENIATRRLRSENARLLKAFQEQQNGEFSIDNKKVSQLNHELYLQKKKSVRLNDRIDQLMAERRSINSDDSLFGRFQAKFYKNKYTKPHAETNEPRAGKVETTGAAPVYLALENVLFSNAYKATLASKFTHVIGHDVLGVGAAVALADRFNAELWIDLVEDMRLEERTGDHYRRTMHDEDIRFLNSYIKSNVLSADKIISIAPWQEGQLTEALKRKSALLPNYRDPYVPNAKTEAQAQKIMKQHNVIGPYICIPNIIRSLDEVKSCLEALKDLNLVATIVHIGPSPREDISSDIQALLNGQNFKFIELGECGYNVYRHILSKAAFSVMSNTSEAQNAKQAYPNRLFDCVSSACPILTYGFIQASEFVVQNKVGVAIEEGENNKKSWMGALKEMSRQRDNYSNHLNSIRNNLNWSAKAIQAFDSIPENSNVLIVSRKDLRKNIRIQKIMQTLQDKNCKVSVIGGHKTHYLHTENIMTVPLMRKLSEVNLIFGDFSSIETNKEAL